MKNALNRLATGLLTWTYPANKDSFIPFTLRRAICHALLSLLLLCYRLLGEEPRSGGGKATSGAGAERKEGEHPPLDLTGSMEVMQ